MRLFFVLTFFSSVMAQASTPAYLRNPSSAGSHWGSGAAQLQRTGYLDRAEGAYCTADMRKLVSAQLSKLPVEAPKKLQWRSGTDYGDYLQSYFAAACAVYTSELNFSGLGEPCGNYRHYYDDYGDGIADGKSAVGALEDKGPGGISRSYCAGDGGAAEAARKSFLNVLNTAITDSRFYQRSEPRAYVRGFVLGLCSGFARKSCVTQERQAAALYFSATSIEQVMAPVPVSCGGQ